MSSNPTLDWFHASCGGWGTNAGVDGDIYHTGEGYHTWRKLLKGGDYSGGRNGTNVSSRDLGGRDNCSAAIDRGFGDPSRIKLSTQRLLTATQSDAGRHMLRGLREFNGTVDNRTTINRDSVLGWRQNYTPSSSHLSHNHLGFYRDTCEDRAVIGDVLAVYLGTWQPGGAVPAPASNPAQPVTPAPSAPKLWQGHPWPGLPAGHYYGLITGPAKSHGGYYANERPIIKIIQQRLIVCGFVPGISNPNSGWADGKFEQPTADAVARFQHAHMPGTQFYGQVWSDDWRKLFNL